MDVSQVEPFAVGYLNSDKNDTEYRVASGIFSFAKNVKIEINPAEVFCGLCGEHNGEGIFFGGTTGIRVDKGARRKQIKRFPKLKVEITKLYDYFEPRDIKKQLAEDYSPLETALTKYKALWGGTFGGHGNPDYGLLLNLGTNGLRKKVEKYKKTNVDKADFYDALLLTLDAQDTLAARYKALAEEKIKTAAEAEKPTYARLISAFENVPQNAPRNFFEACEFFWLTFSFLEIDSPGLFDYFMGPYYNGSEDDYASLKALWKLFYKTRSWNLCVGGSDEKGNDLSNALTYDVLRVARECKFTTPNLTMRFHKNSPEKAWQAAVDTIATGIGMPAIYNDDCVCAAYEKIGVPPADAHLYCMNGCNQIDIFGKSHMGLEDGEISIIKALEFALFDGICRFSHKRLGLRTGKAADFRTFDELMNAYYKQAEYMADAVVALANRGQRLYAENAPQPLRSLLVAGCVESGLDFKHGGPLYNHGQVLTEGLPDTADSLAAIKHFVFDEKKYTMAQLLRALRADFIGYGKLYKNFSSYHKFGNDLDDVDAIYVAITDHIYKYFQTKRTYRGGIYGVGCSTYHRAPNYGIHCGALPNGKKNIEYTLADSIGAVPGCDKNGPTALLNSVLKVDQTLALSGNVMQIKFTKNQFNTDTGKAAFIALAKTYFRLGGQTLQINVVSREELLDAVKHPERHENLIVRVGGYSNYFVQLDSKLQENIILRTENEL